MKVLILSYLISLCLLGFSQEKDTIKIKKKFAFETFRRGKIKKLRQGRYLEVTLRSNDTIHTQSGDLIDLNDSMLTINMLFEDFENASFNKNLILETPKRISIAANSINYVSYESISLITAATIGGIGIITTLIAPIIAIDRDQPHNFNTTQYKHIMGPTLIGMTLGLTIYYTIGSDTMLKLKLPSKNKR